MSIIWVCKIDWLQLILPLGINPLKQSSAHTMSNWATPRVCTMIQQSKSFFTPISTEIKLGWKLKNVSCKNLSKFDHKRLFETVLIQSKSIQSENSLTSSKIVWIIFKIKLKTSWKKFDLINNTKLGDDFISFHMKIAKKLKKNPLKTKTIQMFPAEIPWTAILGPNCGEFQMKMLNKWAKYDINTSISPSPPF